MIYQYKSYNLKKEVIDNITSFKDYDIEIIGNVNQELFKQRLGTFFSFKSLNKKNIFKKEKTRIEIIISFDCPKYIEEIYFDGGENSKMYNETNLIDIKGFTNYFWKELNDFTPYTKIKIVLETSGYRNVDNIIKYFNLLLKG